MARNYRSSSVQTTIIGRSQSCPYLSLGIRFHRQPNSNILLKQTDSVYGHGQVKDLSNGIQAVAWWLPSNRSITDPTTLF